MSRKQIINHLKAQNFSAFIKSLEVALRSLIQNQIRSKEFTFRNLLLVSF